MTTTKGANMIPDNLPLLSAGKQSPGSGAVCAEQAVSWLVSGRLDLGDETDHPECVQPVLNALAIAVNDRIGDDKRHQMWPILLRQPGTAHPEMEPALSVRLAAWCAQQVLHLAADEDQAVCQAAIDASLAWADDPSEENVDAAHAAAAAAHAAHAVYAVYVYAAAAYADAAHAYAYASAASAARAAYAYAYEDLISLLEGAQAECERLTGHTPSEPDIARLARLGEMVGVVSS
jgi:hypothetical protein